MDQGPEYFYSATILMHTEGARSMPDKESLIHAYILDGQGSGKLIGWKEINQWTPEQGILWIHLNYEASKTRQWLSKKSGLDKFTIEAMIADESRPRSVINPHGILTFLRGVNPNPREEPEDMVSIRIWVDEHRIITTRKRKLLSIQDLITSLENNTGPKSPGNFLVMLTDQIINRISDVVERVYEQVDELDEKVVTAESHLLRPKISDARQQIIMIRRYLAPQREALSRLQTDKTMLFDENDYIRLRECGDRIIRHLEDLDSARDRASITQEELSSRLSEQMDRRMYVLSVAAVIFLPLTFITGLLGINVGGIPGAGDRWGFLIVCAFLVIFLFGMLWIFHKKKWI